MEKTCATPKAIEVEISDSSAVTGDIEKKIFDTREFETVKVFFFILKC